MSVLHTLRACLHNKLSFQDFYMFITDCIHLKVTECFPVSGTNRLKTGKDDSDMSYSEGLSGETGSETDERPNSPRAAPVGKDNEMNRVGSVSL